MAYIDDLNAPRPRRQQPLFAGAQQPPTPDVNVTYGGQSPVGTNGAPNQDYTGNTGVVKPTPPPVVPPPPAPPAPPPVTPAPVAPRPASSNPGLDPAKWTSGHLSPKYAFHEVAQKYDQKSDAGRAQTLAELQQRFPQWFTNWTIAGDKLRYAGDPNALDGKWDGFTEFDAWYGSKDNIWTPQWLPTQRNGQAWVDPAQQGAGAAGGAAGGASAGGGGGLSPIAGMLGGAGGFDFGVTGEYGYDDPSTRKLEEFLRLMIDEKTNPINDPARNEYANALRQRFQSLIEPGSGANAGATALDQQLQDAINQLTNPALTENDRARLENRALEPMERDRQIRLQQQKEQLAARGLGESSGIITEALAGIDRDYDARRGEVQRDLSIYEREQQDARRREAIEYGTQRRNVLGTELDREQGRYGQALTMAEALSNLSGQQRGEQDARMREALTYVSLFPEMDERRLRLAMETLGMSNGMANAPSIFNTLSNLQAQANASAQQGQQSNAAFWGQMGQWMANAWPKSGG